MGSIKPYILGFVLSLTFTLLSYGVVILHQNSEHEFLTHTAMLPLILIFAVMQLVVQLIFFLHLKSNSNESRWKTGIFISTVLAVLLVILGSLWIMSHLNNNMMPQDNIKDFIIKDEGIK